tara:strand:- start:181 stop:1551 length:1371 start_codon:yes stop_codon:yes gene_type:complete
MTNSFIETYPNIDLNNFWYYIKDKLFYFTVIILIIICICIYSSNILDRFKILNNIRIKIDETKKKLEDENYKINEYNSQINNISANVIYQQNINDSLNLQIDNVVKNCKKTHENYLDNMNTTSINIPYNIKSKLNSFVKGMTQEEINRKNRETAIANNEYKLKNDQRLRQLKQIRAIQLSRRKAMNQQQERLRFTNIQNTQWEARNAAQKAANLAAALARIRRIGCVTENTLILMSDNTQKEIKYIKLGDQIKSLNGNIINILNIHKQLIDNDILVYGINNIEPFFTESHPIVSADKDNFVLSINPDLTLEENPERINKIKKLSIGDTIYINNKKIQVEKITKKILYKNNYVYDLVLDDIYNNIYIANNVYIESQEPKYISYPNVCGILSNLLFNYNYEDITNELIIKEINKNIIYNEDIMREKYNIIKKYDKNKFTQFFISLNKLWVNYFNLINN